MAVNKKFLEAVSKDTTLKAGADKAALKTEAIKSVGAAMKKIA